MSTNLIFDSAYPNFVSKHSKWWMDVNEKIKNKTHCNIFNLTSLGFHKFRLLIYNSCQPICLFIKTTRIQSTPNVDCMSMKPIKMKTHCKIYNLISLWSHIFLILIYPSCQQIWFLNQPTRIFSQSTPNDDFMSMKTHC